MTRRCRDTAFYAEGLPFTSGELEYDAPNGQRLLVVAGAPLNTGEISVRDVPTGSLLYWQDTVALRLDKERLYGRRGRSALSPSSLSAQFGSAIAPIIASRAQALKKYRSSETKHYRNDLAEAVLTHATKAGLSDSDLATAVLASQRTTVRDWLSSASFDLASNPLTASAAFSVLSLPKKQKSTFATCVVYNNDRLSRTVSGVSDTSVSAEKPKLLAEGADLTEKSTVNLAKATLTAWRARTTVFATATAAQTFIERLAAQVSDGLLPPDQGLWRTWESPGRYVELSEVPERLDNFYRQFAELWANPSTDPVVFAAWVEREFDASIHALADGSGRTTRLLSAMVLARYGLLPPSYPSKKEYYQLVTTPDPATWVETYRGMLNRAQTPG